MRAAGDAGADGADGNDASGAGPDTASAAESAARALASAPAGWSMALAEGSATGTADAASPLMVSSAGISTLSAEDPSLALSERPQPANATVAAA